MTIGSDGSRRCNTCRISCSAAPLAEVITPTRLAGAGSGCLVLIEQAFGAQALFQLFELLLQQAVAGGLHALGDQLVVATRFIQRDAGAHQNLLAVLRPEGDAAVAVAEHRAAHWRGRLSA